jgi:hypothetical protein
MTNYFLLHIWYIILKFVLNTGTPGSMKEPHKNKYDTRTIRYQAGIGTLTWCPAVTKSQKSTHEL